LRRCPVSTLTYHAVRASAARPGQCRPSGPVPPQGAPTYYEVPSGHTRRYSRDAAMGTAARSTHGVLTGYLRGTHRVLTIYPQGYPQGYSRGIHRSTPRGTDKGLAKQGVERVRSRAGRRRRRSRRNPVRCGLRCRRRRRRRRRPGAGREGVRRFRGGPVAAVPAGVATPRYVPGVGG
jgi:hypothetical protein